MDTRAFSIIIAIPIVAIAIFLLYIGLSTATTEKQNGIIDGDAAKFTIDNELANLALQSPQELLRSPDNLQKAFTTAFKNRGYTVNSISCAYNDYWVQECAFELKKGKKPTKVISYYKSIYLPGWSDRTKDLFREIRFKGEYAYE